MKTTIDVTMEDADMVLTNSSGDTFTIENTKRNQELIDFFVRSKEFKGKCIECRSKVFPVDINIAVYSCALACLLAIAYQICLFLKP